MIENETTKALRETSVILEEAYYKLVSVCSDNFLCDTCPLYDDTITNEFGTKCLNNLLYKYSVKLSRIANIFEEKGE